MIYLFDKDIRMTSAWYKHFKNEKDVCIINKRFEELVDNKDYNIDVLVSSGNAFGILDGGLDQVYVECLGNELQDILQKKIYDKYRGEQLLGSALLVEIPKHNSKLCHVPVMRIPGVLLDPQIIYAAMRSVLLVTEKMDNPSIWIPGLGNGTGGVSARVVSAMMFRAYIDYKKSVDKGYEELNWDKINDKKLDDILIMFYREKMSQLKKGV